MVICGDDGGGGGDGVEMMMVIRGGGVLKGDAEVRIVMLME